MPFYHQGHGVGVITIKLVYDQSECVRAGILLINNMLHVLQMGVWQQMCDVCVCGTKSVVNKDFCFQHILFYSHTDKHACTQWWLFLKQLFCGSQLRKRFVSKSRTSACFSQCCWARASIEQLLPHPQLDPNHYPQLKAL